MIIWGLSRGPAKNKGGLVGKPYADELEALTRTYGWAQAVDVGAMAAVMHACADSPLISVARGDLSPHRHTLQVICIPSILENLPADDAL